MTPCPMPNWWSIPLPKPFSEPVSNKPFPKTRTVEPVMSLPWLWNSGFACFTQIFDCHTHIWDTVNNCFFCQTILRINFSYTHFSKVRLYERQFADQWWGDWFIFFFSDMLSTYGMIRLPHFCIIFCLVLLIQFTIY